MPGSVTEPRPGALLSFQYAGLLVKEETRAEQRARYPVSRPEIAASRRYAGCDPNATPLLPVQHTGALDSRF